MTFFLDGRGSFLITFVRVAESQGDRQEATGFCARFCELSWISRQKLARLDNPKPVLGGTDDEEVNT
jgi:hypothetical protein